MGRDKKKSKRERNDRKGRDCKAALHNTRNATEIDFDGNTGTESNQRFSEDIKRPGPSSQTPLEERLSHEAGNTFEDVGADCSQRIVYDIIDKKCKVLYEDLIQAVYFNKCIPEMKLKFIQENLSLTPFQENLTPEVEIHRDLYEYAMSHSPNLVKSIDDSIRQRNQEQSLKNLVNIVQESKVHLLTTEAKSEALEDIDTINTLEKYLKTFMNSVRQGAIQPLTTTAKAEALRQLEAIDSLERYTDLQVTTATADVEYEVNKVVTYLLKTKTQLLTYDKDLSDDNIKEVTYTTPKSTKENKCTSNVSEKKRIPYNIDLENEARMKNIDDMEDMGGAKYVPEMIQTNKLIDVCTKQIKVEEIIYQNLQFILKRMMEFQIYLHANKMKNIKSTLKEFEEWMIFSLDEEIENAELLKNTNASKDDAERPETNLKHNTTRKAMLAKLEQLEEKIIEINENKVNFEFNNYGNQSIYMINTKSKFLMKTRPTTLNFSDKDIKVCFSGKKILVSTKNSEFEFYIRKSNPVILSDKATQTD